MPVDPTISLGVTGGGSGLATPQAPTNPLAFANNVAETQAKLAASQTAQRELSAKRKLGQIMATSSDIPTGIQTALQDPDVAPFAGDAIQTLAGAKNTLQTYRGQVSKLTGDSFNEIAGMLPGLIVNGGTPATKAMIKARINLIPDPGVKANISGVMDDIQTALDDPSLDGDGRMKAVTAAAIGIPGALETLNKLWAAPTEKNRGSFLQQGTTAQSIPTISDQAPGTFTPLTKGLPGDKPGNSLTVTASPGAIGQGSGILGAPPVGGGVGGAASGGSGAAAALLPPPQSAQAGISIMPDGYKVKQLPLDRDALGQPMGPPAKAIQDLIDKFNGPEAGMYSNATVSKGQLAEMESNFDGLAAGGGFMTPGALGNVRLEASKLLNTMGQITGKEPLIDPSKVAKAEDILKGTERMGFSTLSTLLGDQQHAAAETVNHAVNAVPQLDNSYLGSKLLINSIKAAQNRIIDERNFKNWWQSQTKGDLRGAAEEFNRLNPAEKYIKPVLDSFGLTESGFKHPEDIVDQFKKGFLTQAQAKTMIHTQFPSYKGEGR